MLRKLIKEGQEDDDDDRKPERIDIRGAIRVSLFKIGPENRDSFEQRRPGYKGLFRLGQLSWLLIVIDKNIFR